MRNYIWLLVCLLSFCFHPEFVLAHASVIDSTPKENEVLETAPETINIQFSEAIQTAFYSLEVYSESGKKVQISESRISGQNENVLETHLKKTLADGVYLVQWKVVSSDGHPVKGTIPFQVGVSTAKSNPIVMDQDNTMPNSVQTILQSIQYVCFSILIGALFFRLVLVQEGLSFFDYKRIRWLLWLSYSGLALSIFLSLPLKVTIDAEVGWLQAFNKDYIQAMLNETSFGPIWIGEILLLLVLFLMQYTMLENKTNRLAVISYLIVSALMLCKALIGHTQAVSNQVMAVLMDFFHLQAMAVWLGGLLMLLIILSYKQIFLEHKNEWKSFYWRTIRKFSPWVMISVIVLIGTGIYSSIQHIPTFHALLDTVYGRLLLGKILLMLMMIGLGAYHFLKGKKQEKDLNASVRFEFSIGIIVLIVAALLTNVATASSSPGPIEQTQITEGKEKIALSITPNQIGDNIIQVKLLNDAGRPLANLQQLTVKLVSQEIEDREVKLQLKETATGVYETNSIFTMSGKWTVQVHGLTEKLDSIDATFTILIGS